LIISYDQLLLHESGKEEHIEKKKKEKEEKRGKMVASNFYSIA
jgi:hypothetical protein